MSSSLGITDNISGWIKGLLEKDLLKGHLTGKHATSVFEGSVLSYGDVATAQLVGTMCLSIAGVVHYLLLMLLYQSEELSTTCSAAKIN